MEKDNSAASKAAETRNNCADKEENFAWIRTPHYEFGVLGQLSNGANPRFL